MASSNSVQTLRRITKWLPPVFIFLSCGKWRSHPCVARSGPGNYPLVPLAIYVQSQPLPYAKLGIISLTGMSERHHLPEPGEQFATFSEVLHASCQVNRVQIRSCKQLLGHSTS